MSLRFYKLSSLPTATWDHSKTSTSVDYTSRADTLTITPQVSITVAGLYIMSVAYSGPTDLDVTLNIT